MKRFYYLYIAAFALMALAPKASAQSAQGVPLSGTAYGDKIGLLHMQVYTAIKPGDPVDSDPAYYVGPTNQFYIDPTDPAYQGTPDVNDADVSVVANVSTLSADCQNDRCLLKGFMWSDTIGWIALNGLVINEAIIDAQVKAMGGDQAQAEQTVRDDEVENGGTPCNGNTPPGCDPYDPSLYPSIDSEGELAGFAWNTHTGWLSLAEGLGGTSTEPASQTVADWGVFLQVDASPDPDVGRPLRGYAWSEHMGWIKFGFEAADSLDFIFGVYTSWIPDDTGPAVLSNNPVWFQVATPQTGFTSTGNDADDEAAARNIVYLFAEDPESGIDLNNSRVRVISDVPGCSATGEPGAHSYQDVPDITQSETNQFDAFLYLASAGSIQNTASASPGYCRYYIDAAVHNGVNLVSYAGDHFYDMDVLDPGVEVPPDAPKQEQIVVYVRAGDIHGRHTVINQAVNSTYAQAIADGDDYVEYEFQLRDIVGNAVVDIECTEYVGCPGRDISLTGNMNPSNKHQFNVTGLSPECGTPPCATPVKVHKEAVSLLSGANGLLTDEDETVPIYRPASDHNFNLQAASYTPSASYDPLTNDIETKSFFFTGYDHITDHDQLPPTNYEIISADPLEIALDNDTILSAYQNSGPVPATTPQVNVAFTPPVITTNAQVFTGDPDAGGLEDILSLGSEANLTFDIANLAPFGLNNIDIDTIFQFYSGGGANPILSLLETYHIKNTSAGDADPDAAGWSDPFSVETRYEWLDPDSEEFDDTSIAIANSFFRNEFPYYFNFTLTDTLLYSDVDSAEDGSLFLNDYSLPATTDILDPFTGEYYLTGTMGIPEEYNEEDHATEYEEPFHLPPSVIDRVDFAELNLDAAGSALPDFDTREKQITFTPQKFVPETITDINFRVIQEIAYRYDAAPLFSIYSATNPLKDGLTVKDLALEAIGTVAGEQIITGREFEVVGTAGVSNLQELIRFNVAQLTLDINKEACPVPGTSINLFSTDSANPCIIHDEVNGTYVAYYNGDSNQHLVLNNGGSGLVVPDAPYTIIVEGGAHLVLADNLYYDNTANPNGSLGFIVMADQTATASEVPPASVFIRPEPTNIVGVLYTEGSLLSMDDSNNFYYGDVGPLNELSNQLYWRGSIASRNTIAGSGRAARPEGTTCVGASALECAQRYDLDFIRRFTANSNAVANNGLFSGGGSCDPVGGCVHGAESAANGGLLLSTVVLNTGPDPDEIDVDASQLAPFFIERDPLRENNPPPGFSISGEQETIQIIR